MSKSNSPEKNLQMWSNKWSIIDGYFTTVCNTSAIFFFFFFFWWSRRRLLFSKQQKEDPQKQLAKLVKKQRLLQKLSKTMGAPNTSYLKMLWWHACSQTKESLQMCKWAKELPRKKFADVKQQMIATSITVCNTLSIYFFFFFFKCIRRRLFFFKTTTTKKRRPTEEAYKMREEGKALAKIRQNNGETKHYFTFRCFCTNCWSSLSWQAWSQTKKKLAKCVNERNRP